MELQTSLLTLVDEFMMRGVKLNRLSRRIFEYLTVVATVTDLKVESTASEKLAWLLILLGQLINNDISFGALLERINMIGLLKNAWFLLL